MQTSTTSKLLVSDIASSVDRVPSSYIRQISDRPNISDVDIFGDSIPLIDLQELYGPSRANIIHQFAHACSSYSFFQISHLDAITYASHANFYNIQAPRVRHRLLRGSRPFKLYPTNL
ncbi:hypothetical protein F2Q68_00002266 [Brassica cretica]|uniref:Non-haem dioxygenase N-terminal domain-containing protein n=1 Tax=Brassica cretica TaxID=69181 RepID=A0A8S9JCS8_BRACR|nr:hypothetical protein F2Q68_00002266 [Brassica cretica]